MAARSSSTSATEVEVVGADGLLLWDIALGDPPTEFARVCVALGL